MKNKYPLLSNSVSSKPCCYMLKFENCIVQCLMVDNHTFGPIHFLFFSFYRVVFFNVQKLILNKKNLSKLRYRGLVFCIFLCEVCSFLTYISFECEVPSVLVLYSRTEMLKLRKPQTLHQKTQTFGSFCSNGL